MSVDEAARSARFAPILRAELAALQAQSAETGADRRPVEPDQQSVGRLSRMEAIQGQQMAAAIEARRGQRIVAIRSGAGASRRRLRKASGSWPGRTRRAARGRGRAGLSARASGVVTARS